MKQYLYQEKNGTLKATRYKPSYSDDEYNGFGHYYDKKTGKWLSGVAVFADDFTTDTSGSYTLDDATIEVFNGKLKVTNINTYGNASIVKTTIVGKKYKVVAKNTTGTTTNRIYILDGATIIGDSEGIIVSQYVEFEFIATSTSTKIALYTNSTTNGQYTYYDNIAVIPLNDDGTVDLSNGTPVSPEITYTGQVVEVDTQGNPLYADKFDVPTLQEEYIVADKVKTDVLKLGLTEWINSDGIEYKDDGLKGVPDTTFSSTGARLYPDGSIRGKSDLGEYIKYPNGRLECTGTASFDYTTITTVYGVFPHDTIDTTYSVAISCTYTSDTTLRAAQASLTSFPNHTTQVGLQNSSVFAQTRYVRWGIKGYWK